jgi:group I intron endonuclease
MDISDYKKIPKLPGIYKLINVDNSKIYIGSAVNLRVRVRRHNYELNKQVHSNKRMQRSFDKGSKFNVEVIELFENINYEELLVIEKKYIISLNAIEDGYNQMLDNSTQFQRLNKTKEHKKKVKAHNAMPILSFDRYTGKKNKRFESVSDAANYYGTQSTNISKACKGNLNYVKEHVFIYEKDYDENKEYSYSKHWTQVKGFSDQHKERLKKANQKSRGIKISKFDFNGNLVKIYPSRLEAERCNKMHNEFLRWNDFTHTPFEGFFYK